MICGSILWVAIVSYSCVVSVVKCTKGISVSGHCCVQLLQLIAMSRKAQQYATSGPMDSPVVQKKQSSFKNFLLELSKDFNQEMVDDLKTYVALSGQCNDSGCLPSLKIEQTKTLFGLFMALVESGFMKPDNMSGMIEFLHSSRKDMLEKRVQEFQAQAQRSKCVDLHYMLCNYVIIICGS